MAAFVQGTGVQSAGSVNSVNKAYASNVTAGNLLVAACVSSQQTMPAGSVTDSQGNSWALDKSQERGASEWVNIFSAVAGSSAANTVTLNCTGSDFQSLAIAEFSPAGGSTWSTTAATRLGPTNSSTGTSQGTLSTGSMTAGADGVVVGGVSHGGSTITITPSSGSQVYENESAANMPISMLYLLATSGNAYNPSWTVASSTGGWTASGASYKETAGGGGGGTAVPVFLHHMITQGMA